MSQKSDELFSLMLRLHPVSAGQVQPSSGNQVQAAFLDMIRQSDPELSERLHEPNQRRPYTLSLLQGFNHLTPTQMAEATARRQSMTTLPGQVYWLRITIMDASIFSTFTQHLITRAHALRLHIGDTDFEISRLLANAESSSKQSWLGHTSFTELFNARFPQKHYTFEFASPTAFSKGQKSWGKQLVIFPEPSLVFESIARLWDSFAPEHVRLSAHDLSFEAIAAWCEEQVITTQYTLETRYLSSSKFGQVGFQGHVSYEVKGNPNDPQAQWLSTLARFALFSGIGYKTTMGMGQARCTSLGPLKTSAQTAEAEGSLVHE